jgi:hypothetical protein
MGHPQALYLDGILQLAKAIEREGSLDDEFLGYSATIKLRQIIEAEPVSIGVWRSRGPISS